MDRRGFLGLVAAGLGGCQGISDSSTADPPQIDCNETTRPSPEASTADSVSPESYPDPPDGDGIPEWATAHEEAYLVNEHLNEYPLKRWNGLSIGELHEETYRGGTVVRFSYTYGFAYDNVHADSAILTVAYYVNERGALRAPGSSSDLEDDLDPTTAGEPVVCF